MGRSGAKHLTPEIKRLIVQLYQTNKRDGTKRTQVDIANNLGISLSNVAKTLKRFRTTGHPENYKFKGRRRTLTVWDVNVRVSLLLHFVLIFPSS
jgi:DNA-binding Lrp family transcriptional regulator